MPSYNQLLVGFLVVVIIGQLALLACTFGVDCRNSSLAVSGLRSGRNGWLTTRQDGQATVYITNGAKTLGKLVNAVKHLYGYVGYARTGYRSARAALESALNFTPGIAKEHIDNILFFYDTMTGIILVVIIDQAFRILRQVCLMLRMVWKVLCKLARLLSSLWTEQLPEQEIDNVNDGGEPEN